VVTDTTGHEFIEVKLDINTYALFPKILFNNTDKIILGQHFKYQIKENASGYRYQYFKPFFPTIAEDDNKTIIDLLNKFEHKL